jgi:hypothetical protein
VTCPLSMGLIRNQIQILFGSANDCDQWLAAHGLAITQDDNCESIASRGSGLNPLQTKPFTDNHRNCIHLVGR